MPQLFSYSRLETFVGCPRNYYWTYIKGQRGGESIYSYLGTAAHDLVEAMDKGEISNDDAVSRFKEEVDNADMLGLTWITPKSKLNYVECILHYLQFHEASKEPNQRIEDVFAVEIGEIVIWGFIDRWSRDGNTITITDYKTSSKFSAAELEHKKMQLFIYAEALSKYYPEYTIKIRYDMLKYAKVGKTFKPRNEIPMNKEYSEGYVAMEYTEDNRQELCQFVNDTMAQINARDPEDIFTWEMARDPKTSFFCKSLCAHCDKCCCN